MTEQHHAFDAFDRQCEDLRDKWLRHRAKPEVWAAVEKLGKNEMNAANCALELRARVEALEAAQQPNVKKEMQGLQGGTRLLSYRVENSALPIEEWGKGHTIVDSAKPAESSDPAEPNSSLVEQVAKGVGSASPWMHSHRDEARAAIREVAAWLRLHTDLTHGPLCALWIEQELKKTS